MCLVDFLVRFLSADAQGVYSHLIALQNSELRIDEVIMRQVSF